MAKIDSTNIMQVTIVVPDIEKAVQNTCDLFGVERPNIRHHSGPDKCVFYANGEKCEIGDVLLCTFEFGPVGFEFAQVIDAENTSWNDFIKRYGYGVHNIGFYVDDLDSALEALAEKNARPIHTCLFRNESYCIVNSEDAIGVRLNIKHRGENNEAAFKA